MEIGEEQQADVQIEAERFAVLNIRESCRKKNLNYVEGRGQGPVRWSLNVEATEARAEVNDREQSDG